MSKWVVKEDNRNEKFNKTPVPSHCIEKLLNLIGTNINMKIEIKNKDLAQPATKMNGVWEDVMESIDTREERQKENVKCETIGVQVGEDEMDKEAKEIRNNKILLIQQVLEE